MTSDFPSRAWFNRAVARATADEAALERLGTAELRFGAEILHDDGRVEMYGLILDGYDVSAVGPVSESDFWPEVVVSGSLETWRDMVANIEEKGHADPGHTLNALSLADTPLSVRSPDVMGQDKLYQFMGTVQAVFDAAGVEPARVA